jgi:predicted DNA-binding transcriptional regulator AlpA
LPRKNTIRKIGKRVVSRGGADAVTLIANHSHGGPGYRPSARGPPRLPPLPPATYIDAPQLLARFGGRSHMWLVRLLARDPTFPRPVKIGRLRFFVVADLEAWERKTAAESRARAA